METIVETGIAALLFAATFLIGGKIKPLRRFIKNPRSIISFGAGMSAAYVFMHLMPELHEARRTFVESVSMTLRFEGMAIYFLSLLGFLVFYGLDHLRDRLDESIKVGEIGLAFKLQVGGFTAYVWLMSYLLIHHLGTTSVSTAMYAMAIAFHFLALDHTLRHEHGETYQRIGRFVLATAAILGWASGLLFSLPHHILALLVAFISGAIIMNSAMMELSDGKGARYLPFLSGGIIYGLILLPLG
jgi:hypothetical protein